VRTVLATEVGVSSVWFIAVAFVGGAGIAWAGTIAWPAFDACFLSHVCGKVMRE